MKFPAIPVSKDRLIRRYDIAASQTFKKGAAVLMNSSEEVAECAADPAAVLGFAAEPAGGSALFSRGDPETGGVLVCIAEPHRRFHMQGDNNPTMDDVNQSYGIAKDADGYWYVDGTDTTNKVVYVHNVDLERNLYEVSVLVGVAQMPPTAALA